MDDLISRQAAIDAINEHLEFVTSGLGSDSEVKKIYKIAYNHTIDVISILPDIQPEQKIGQWIYKERNILINTGRVSYGENGAVQEKRWAKVKKPYCSECGWYENSEYEATPYCPNCGAHMKGESDD